VETCERSANADADGNRLAHCDTFTYTHAYPNANCDAYTYGSGADAYPYADANCDTYADGSGTYAYCYADSRADQHTYTYTYGYGGAYAGSTVWHVSDRRRRNGWTVSHHGHFERYI
jgi:hypothetical protein